MVFVLRSYARFSPKFEQAAVPKSWQALSHAITTSLVGFGSRGPGIFPEVNEEAMVDESLRTRGGAQGSLMVMWCEGASI